MNVKRCDICKKEVEKDIIQTIYSFRIRKDFCLKCGKPVFDFLKENKLLSNEEK